jgi:hypothetical protein
MSYWQANGNQVPVFYLPSVSYINPDFGLANYPACHCLLASFLLNLFLRPWRWRRYVPPKRRLTLNGLHGVISQKTIFFITTAVKTSDPMTCLYFEYSFYPLPFSFWVHQGCWLFFVCRQTRHKASTMWSWQSPHSMSFPSLLSSFSSILLMFQNSGPKLYRLCIL